jgi:hypothetical protein
VIGGLLAAVAIGMWVRHDKGHLNKALDLGVDTEVVKSGAQYAVGAARPHGHRLSGDDSDSSEADFASADPNLIPASNFTEPPPIVLALATPIPPPNPILYQPPMDNPGGVDGDRPPRQVPGL